MVKVFLQNGGEGLSSDHGPEPSLVAMIDAFFCDTVLRT